MSREHLTTIHSVQHIPAVNETRIVTYIKGQVDVRAGDNIIVTTKEGRK